MGSNSFIRIEIKEDTMEKEKILEAIIMIRRIKEELQEMVDKYGEEVILDILAEFLEQKSEVLEEKPEKKKYRKKKLKVEIEMTRKDRILKCPKCGNKEGFYSQGKNKKDGSSRWICKKCKKYFLTGRTEKASKKEAIIFTQLDSQEEKPKNMVIAEFANEEEKAAFHFYRSKKITPTKLEERPEALIRISEDWRDNKERIIRDYLDYRQKLADKANRKKAEPDDDELDRVCKRLGSEPEDDEED